MLKKIICTLAGVGLMVGTATSVFGASKASLFLVGNVEVICNIFINPVLGDLDTLDIINGETGRNVANVDEETNNTTGYRIDMESVNAETSSIMTGQQTLLIQLSMMVELLQRLRV